MTEEMGTEEQGPSDITSDDKLWAALGYPIPVVALIVLFMEDKKNRPFIKFHAVQSIAFNLVIVAVALVISAVTLGFGAICFPLFWFVSFWPAYDSYQGNFTELPVLTNFIKNQGWA
jgi:uncharacterized membrane protein